MAQNPKVNIDNYYVPKYATHWHLRLTEPTPEASDILKETLDGLYQSKYITYVLLTEATDPDSKRHYHLAIGTSKSIKPETLRRKLGILTTAGMKTIAHCYYLQPVYNDSTPESNYNYVLNGHNKIFELGMIDPDIANKKINTLPLIF